MKTRLCVFLGIVRCCVAVLYSVRESKVISKFTLGRHIFLNVYCSFQIYLSNQHCVGWRCQDFWSPIHITFDDVLKQLRDFRKFTSFHCAIACKQGDFVQKLSKTGSSENIEILQTLWCQRSLDLLREVQIKFVSSKSFHSGSIPRISFWSVPDTNFDVIYL